MERDPSGDLLTLKCLDATNYAFRRVMGNVVTVRRGCITLFG